MRRAALIIGLASLVGIGGAAAQSTAQRPGNTPPPQQGVTCPPDVRGAPPTVGGPQAPDLSDKLADSKGVICPPAGIDQKIERPAPGGGELKVVPPPGSPGGNPNVQPK